MTEEQRAELEKLARAAKEVWAENTWVQEAGLEDAFILDPQDRAFIAASSPATVLDLLATIARLEAEAVKDGEALTVADQFITNGVGLGFIRMPDADCHDPAHDTPRIIRARLSSRAKDQSQ